jgi:hypothetical protein
MRVFAGISGLSGLASLPLPVPNATSGGCAVQMAMQPYLMTIVMIDLDDGRHYKCQEPF